MRSFCDIGSGKSHAYGGMVGGPCTQTRTSAFPQAGEKGGWWVGTLGAWSFGALDITRGNGRGFTKGTELL